VTNPVDVVDRWSERVWEDVGEKGAEKRNKIKIGLNNKKKYKIK